MTEINGYFADKPQLLVATIIITVGYLLFATAVAVIARLRERKRSKLISLAEKLYGEYLSEGCEFTLRNTEGGFVAELLQNGEAICGTEEYFSLAGAKSALKSLKTNIKNGNFTVKTDGEGTYSVVLYSSNKALFESSPVHGRDGAEDLIRKITAAARSAEENEAKKTSEQ